MLFDAINWNKNVLVRENLEPPHISCVQSVLLTVLFFLIFHRSASPLPSLHPSSFGELLLNWFVVFQRCCLCLLCLVIRPPPFLLSILPSSTTSSPSSSSLSLRLPFAAWFAGLSASASPVVSFRSSLLSLLLHSLLSSPSVSAFHLCFLFLSHYSLLIYRPLSTA